MKSSALSRSFVSVATAAATIASMGAPGAFAFFDNKVANVNVFSSAYGVSTTTSKAKTTTNTTQVGGPFSNQFAASSNSTTSTAVSNQNVQSGNVVMISQ